MFDLNRVLEIYHGADKKLTIFQHRRGSRGDGD